METCLSCIDRDLLKVSASIMVYSCTGRLSYWRNNEADVQTMHEVCMNFSSPLETGLLISSSPEKHRICVPPRVVHRYVYGSKETARGTQCGDCLVIVIVLSGSMEDPSINVLHIESIGLIGLTVYALNGLCLDNNESESSMNESGRSW